MKLNILIAFIVVIAVIASGCTQFSDDNTIVIGSKQFQESYILAHMISLLLEEHGYETDVKEGLGGGPSSFRNHTSLHI
jgi:osmoprotectant transport system substrate-binding protein